MSRRTAVAALVGFTLVYLLCSSVAGNGADDRAFAVPAASRSAALVPASCTNLSCAGRFAAVEPAWANLSFQPSISRREGGVRGDCVAGKLEFVLHKYCSSTPRSGKFPSEARLDQLDVHSALLPKADLAELVTLLPNRTILFMGDSVTEQFYNAVQCFLRREALVRPIDAPFLEWVDATAPLWRMGKRKKPPKLPQAAQGGMRMMYSRVTTMMLDEVEA